MLPRFRTIPNAGRLGSLFAVRNASSRNGPGRPSRIISTLLPEKLLPSDLLDLSGRQASSLKLFEGEQESAMIEYFQLGREMAKFPRATKGFLYFHRPEPYTPLLACSVRFRICKTPETFSTGSNLLLPDGRPWEKAMWWIIQAGWADLLAESGVISQNELDLCRPFANPRSTIIRTLLPEEFLPSDLVELSGIEHQSMKLFTDNQESAQINYIKRYGRKRTQFPPETRGFLYFHCPDPHAPLLTCSMRFRICQSPDAFSTGKDLLYPDGTPWRKSMWWMARNGWADLLAERKVISKQQLEKCRPFISCDVSRSNRLVHAFNQTFPVAVTESATLCIRFYILGEESLVPLSINGLAAFRSYLKEKVGHGIEGDITLNLHIEQDGTLRLSETVPPPYGEILQKGMVSPCLYIAKQSLRQNALLPKLKSDPIRYALDILREHEKRSSSAS